jgi:hypothetical protein
MPHPGDGGRLCLIACCAVAALRRPRPGIPRAGPRRAWPSADYCGCSGRLAGASGPAHAASLIRHGKETSLVFPTPLPVSVPRRPEGPIRSLSWARSTGPLRGSNDVGHIRHLAEATPQRLSVDSIMRKG